MKNGNRALPNSFSVWHHKTRVQHKKKLEIDTYTIIVSSAWSHEQMEPANIRNRTKGNKLHLELLKSVLSDTRMYTVFVTCQV